MNQKKAKALRKALDYKVNSGAPKQYEEQTMQKRLANDQFGRPSHFWISGSLRLLAASARNQYQRAKRGGLANALLGAK